MKEFLKKFWHYIVIGVLGAAIIAMIIVMCVCMVPKGSSSEGDNGGNESTQLAAPQNLSVSVDKVLMWDEVDNAGSYTVKINDDETTTVTKNSLDLTLDTVKAKLVRGNNTLAVKANATKNYTASAYSTAITYEYAITPQEEAAAYARIVDSIETITANSSYSAAMTAQTKIEEAKMAYEALSDAAYAFDSVTSAKASFDTKKASFDSALEEANTAYGAFVENSLTPAKAVMEATEDYDELVEKTTAATTAYEALSTLAKTMLTENEENAEAKAAYELLAPTVEAWEEEIDAATTAWNITFDNTNATDDDAEEYIAAATELTAKYDAEDNGYPAYVKAKITNYDAVTADLEEAQTQIKNTVDGLQAKIVEVSEKIKNNQIAIDDLEEYYEELAAIQEKELGAYATKLWNEAKGEDDEALDLNEMLEDGIEALLEIPCKEDSAMRIFVFGATGKINILYTATNVKGEPIAKTPTLSVTIEATTPSPENPVFTKLSNGIYFYECEFTQLNADDYNYTLAVAYSINGVEKQASTKYKAYMDTFFENGYTAIVNGTVAYNGAPNNEAYFDIYLDGDIEFNTSNNDALPTMKALPLLSKVPVKNGMTVDEFRKQLATTYPELIGKEYNVRFVLYQDREDEVVGNNVIHLSCVKGDRISHDTYLLDLTADDAKTRVNLTAPGMGIADNGSLDMGAAYNGVEAQLNELGANHSDLEWIIKVTAGQKSGTFTLDYDGNFTGEVMLAKIFGAIGAVGNVEITFELRIAAKEDSEWNNTLRVSNPVTLTKTLDVSLPDNTRQVRFTSDGGYLQFFYDPEGPDDNKVYSGVFNFGVKAVEMRIQKDGKSYSMYIMTPNGNALRLYDDLYDDLDSVEESKFMSLDSVKNGWAGTGDFNNWVKAHFTEVGNDFDVRDWAVSTKVIFDGDYGVESEYSTSVTYNS